MSEFRSFRVEDHARLIAGFPFDSKYFRTEEGVPLVRIRDLLSGHTEARFSGTYDSAYLINPRDILIGMDGDFNVARWKGGQALLNQRLLKIAEKPGSGLDLDFLFYVLEPLLKSINDKTSATTVKHLSTFDVANSTICAPTRSEQRKIARILTTLDELIERTEALIAKLQAVKQGLMHDLFTRGVDEHGRLRPSHAEAPELYWESELGWIPKGWVSARVGSVAKLIGGFAFASSLSTSSGMRWLKIANVGFEEAVWDEIDFLPEKLVYRHQDYLLQEGDIVVAMTRPIIRGQLKIAVLSASDVPALLNQRVGKLKCQHPADSRFVYHALQCPDIVRQLEYSMLGTDPPNLSSRQFESAVIRLPPTLERERLGVLADHSRKVVLELRRSLQRYRTLKSGLMRDLLTGRVRVTVDAAEEAAADA